MDWESKHNDHLDNGNRVTNAEKNRINNAFAVGTRLRMAFTPAELDVVLLVQSPWLAGRTHTLHKQSSNKLDNKAIHEAAYIISDSMTFLHFQWASYDRNT